VAIIEKEKKRRRKFETDFCRKKPPFRALRDIRLKKNEACSQLFVGQLFRHKKRKKSFRKQTKN
jgi:hypothetical protein